MTTVEEMTRIVKGAPANLSNVLNEKKKHQIIALAQICWALRFELKKPMASAGD